MDSKHKQRLFLSVFFFLSGICFSTWASRIPTIKATFGFNDAELGTVLLFMPLSSLIGLPISGWLVSKFDSRIPLTAGFIMIAVALVLIGQAKTPFQLIASICLFAFSFRVANISINTQALTLQKQFEQKINGSLHGLWSTGGIIGVGYSTIMVALGVPITYHFLTIAIISLTISLYSRRFLLKNDKVTIGNKLIIGKPDPYILFLGLLVFLGAICEGGMFDWSGIYFREEIKVELFTTGYFIFMICMSISRFASDKIIEIIGMPKTYLLSALFIISGITLATVFNSLWPAIFGFSLVGLGVAAIIPMTYTLAGYSKKYSPGMAVSIIATYGTVGMLIGPPLIGYLSHALNLRVSFVAFAIAGFMIIPISQLFFKRQKAN